MSKPLEFFVFGSCVSRDPFENSNPLEIKLIDYYARSSFASLGAKAFLDHKILERIESNWQRRMVEADMTKSVFNRLASTSFDFILIDFIDERFHVSALRDSIHTVSTEYKKALYCPNGYKIINSYSDKKFALWKRGFEKFSNIIKALDKEESVIINEVYWTVRLDNGEDIVDRYSGEQIRKANEFLALLYNEVRSHLPKAKFISYPKEIHYVDSKHKWGVEPFHFNGEMFKRQNEYLSQLCYLKNYSSRNNISNYNKLDFVEDNYGRKMYYKFSPAQDPTNAPILVVLHGHTYNVEPSKFHDSNWNVIAPIDNFGVNNCGSWWLGENGDFFVKDLLHKIVKNVQSNTKSKKGLFFWGSSMGGFGALLHGCLLGAKAVYANIPQIKLLGSTYSNKGMKKFFEPIFSDDINDAGLKYNDVTNFIDKNNPSNNPVFFVAQSRFDYPQYLEEQSLYFFKTCMQYDVNIHYEVFPLSGHKLMLPVNEAISKVEYLLSKNEVGDANSQRKTYLPLEKDVDLNNALRLVIHENKIDLVVKPEKLRSELKAFRLLYNGSVIEETKYIRERKAIFKLKGSGVYRGVCLFKDRERLITNPVRVTCLETDELTDIENYVSDAQKKLKYVYALEKDEYDNILLKKKYLFDETKKVGHLIDICRMEKKMHARYTDFARECAKLAFDTNQCEKTLYFYLESHLLNSSYKKANQFLRNIRLIRNDKKLRDVIKLHEASLHALEEDWVSYDSKLKEFKKDYIPGIYWQSDLLVVDKHFGKNEKVFIGNELVINPSINAKQYILSVSCDGGYFNLYAEYFLKSFKKKCAEEGSVHLFLVNAEKEKIEAKLREWEVEDFVYTAYCDVPKEIDFRPVSATLRLVAVSELLIKYKVPVLFSELDCIIKKPLYELIEKMELNDSDQLIRLIGAILPWQRYTCGFGGFLPTKYGLKSACFLKEYCYGLFNNNDRLLWADQCALEASIRYSHLESNEYSTFSPPLSLINDYVLTPTGSQEKKIFELSKLY